MFGLLVFMVLIVVFLLMVGFCVIVMFGVLVLWWFVWLGCLGVVVMFLVVLIGISLFWVLCN